MQHSAPREHLTSSTVPEKGEPMNEQPHTIAPAATAATYPAQPTATPTLARWNEPQTQAWLGQALPIPMSNRPLAHP